MLANHPLQTDAEYARLSFALAFLPDSGRGGMERPDRVEKGACLIALLGNQKGSSLGMIINTEILSCYPK